jgi:hypothetical protein
MQSLSRGRGADGPIVPVPSLIVTDTVTGGGSINVKEAENRDG